MALWIVTIAKEQPGNLQQAIRNEFWDMTSSQDIMPGDDVVFWQLNGSPVISGPKMLAVATSGTNVIQPGDPPGNWGQPDDRNYSHRFTFEVVEPEADPGLKWGDVQKAIGGQPRLWSVRQLESAAAIDVVLARFKPSWRYVDVSTPPTKPEPALPTYEDRRVFAMRRLAVRQGQQKFRSELMRAYGRKCAFSGCATESVLEAAHIFRYFGDHTNRVTNGLLLRSDLHSLFDAFLIGIDSAYRIRVSSTIKDECYRELDFEPVLLPEDSAAWPHRDSLADHWRDCPTLPDNEFLVAEKQTSAATPGGASD